MTEHMTPDDILETIYDAMPDGDHWGVHLYPARDTWPGPTELYFTDHNGVCWQITAKEHRHG